MMCQWFGLASYGIPDKRCNQNLIMRKQQINQNWETVEKVKSRYSSEMPSVWKTRQRLSACSEWGRLKTRLASWSGDERWQREDFHCHCRVCDKEPTGTMVWCECRTQIRLSHISVFFCVWWAQRLGRRLSLLSVNTCGYN